MKVAILTANTKVYRGQDTDESGQVLEELIEDAGLEVVFRRALPVDREVLESVLASIADDEMADLILTTGGAGCNPGDCTPEATTAVIERPVPGIPEALRANAMQLTKRAMLNRGTAGIRGRVLIVNLPGKPHGARESLKYLLPELVRAVEVIQKEG